MDTPRPSPRTNRTRLQAEVDGNLICANQREGLYVSGAGSKALAHKNEITQNGVKGVGIQEPPPPPTPPY